MKKERKRNKRGLGLDNGPSGLAWKIKEKIKKGCGLQWVKAVVEIKENGLSLGLVWASNKWKKGFKMGIAKGIKKESWNND